MICKCVNEDSYEKAVEKMYIETMDENTYIVKVKGDTTTVINKNGDVGVATCHPDDKFDIVEGFKYAMQRLNKFVLDDDEKLMLKNAYNMGAIYILVNHETDTITFTDDTTDIRINLYNNDMFSDLESHKIYEILDLLES
jgi:hypothetical protein